MMQSVTEQSNILTQDIDICSPEGIVRILRQADAQMFCGFGTMPGLFDDQILDSMFTLSYEIAKLMMNASDPQKMNENKIIFSGCGTSGRFAHFCSKNYNKLFKKYISKDLNQKKTLFHYLIAGGDRALVSPQEAAEDKPNHGIYDLKHMDSPNETDQKSSDDQNIYIGITCGLSAPYVAGQLFECMSNHKKYHSTVLLGFNTVDCARDIAIESWNCKFNTFKSIAMQMEDKSKQNPSQYIILNPIVGPEAITGSTRMKGGSATKILLDVVISTAIQLTQEKTTSVKQNVMDWIFQYLHGFETAYRYTYSHIKSIAQIIHWGQHALRNGGHIYYLGHDNAGILGFIDASECVPTYGAQFDDVRGFLLNGWDAMMCKQSEELGTLKEDRYQISMQYFDKCIIPKLTKEDLVIALTIDDPKESTSNAEILKSLNKVSTLSDVHTAWVNITSTTYSRLNCVDSVYRCHIKLPSLCLLEGMNGYAEFSLKLVLNAITTGSHVMKGMTYGNRMINLKVSNNKLFHRAVRIVSSIMNISEEIAKECVIKSIYRKDNNLDVEMNDTSVEQHISVAVNVDKVVPIALLLASNSKNCTTVQQAKNALDKYPVVRSAIQCYLMEQ